MIHPATPRCSEAIQLWHNSRAQYNAHAWDKMHDTLMLLDALVAGFDRDEMRTYLELTVAGSSIKEGER